MRIPPANQKNARSSRAGAMLVLIVICLPVILGFGIFSVNVAWMQLTRTELRTATDAAAKAGSRALSVSQDVEIGRQFAIEAASRNQVGGSPMLMADSDVVFGAGNENAVGGYDFESRADSSRQLTSVQVTGDRRAGSLGGSVPLLFNGFFDRTSFEPVRVAVATQIDRDIALVLDRSGSMRKTSGSGTRWEALQSAVDGFLFELSLTPQEEKVSLSTYALTASLDFGLTLDYPLLQAAIARQSIRGRTGIGLGMQHGIASLTDPDLARALALKTIVVMTDGNHNNGVDPEVIAAEAVALGITVHTITFSSGANQTRMRRLAEDGGGRHWHADDEESLVDVFREVARNLPTLLTR
ncbi:MAG: VWA domain-containing protein [Fuerstiella sp.]